MFEISRRDLVLSAAGAYAAFGLAKPIAFIGAAEAQQATPGFRKYKIGDIEVISLYDGVWEKPHDENFIKGASVDETKAALRAGGLTDAFVPIPFTTLAVKTGGRLVLIDSGTGGGQVGGPKAGQLAQNMAAAGLDPKDVKTVIVSHFHGDHIFGLMAKDTNAQTFPEAEIIVPAAELKWWTQPVDSIPQPRGAATPSACRPRCPTGRTSRWSTARPMWRPASAPFRPSAIPRDTRPTSSARAASSSSPPPTPPTSRRCSSRIRRGRRRSTTCRIWRWRRARNCSTAPSPIRRWWLAITGACRTSAPLPRTATGLRSRRRRVMPPSAAFAFARNGRPPHEAAFFFCAL